jgi:2-oxo-4-hydroxy-4-carboxy--5-ureidoimidazoline (OHCU) decarboxylase
MKFPAPTQKLFSMKRTTFILAFVPLFAGCTAMAELAYDLGLQHERESCNKAPDMNAQRACKERNRATEQQAEKIRKGG